MSLYYALRYVVLAGVCLAPLMATSIRGLFGLRKREDSNRRDKPVAICEEGTCKWIAMTTALGDARNFFSAFREQCDWYLMKPIDQSKLAEFLQSSGLLAA
jgi:hypothetical protein